MASIAVKLAAESPIVQTFKVRSVAASGCFLWQAAAEQVRFSDIRRSDQDEGQVTMEGAIWKLWEQWERQ